MSQVFHWFCFFPALILLSFGAFLYSFCRCDGALPVCQVLGLGPGIRCGPQDVVLTLVSKIGSGSPLASLPLVVAGMRHSPCRTTVGTAVALVPPASVSPGHPWLLYIRSALKPGFGGSSL